VQGVSTPKVKQITEELVEYAFSASAISAINKRLDASLKAFCERKLKEPFPSLILDALRADPGGWHHCQPRGPDRDRG